jgi:hypothetical protein
MANRVSRLFLAALLAVTASLSQAQYVSTDYSDLWGPVAGSTKSFSVTMTHQRDTIVFSIYLYDDARQPRWYLAAAKRTSGETFSGTLNSFSGTPLLSGETAAAPTPTTVGTATVTFSSANAAAMTLTVNGQQVSANLVRYATAAENLSGNYLEAFSLGTDACGGGDPVEGAGAALQITHSGASFQMVESVSGLTCVYASNNYVQQGKMGRASGIGSCTDGTSIPFAFDELQATRQGISAVLTFDLDNCQIRGSFVGSRRN